MKSIENLFLGTWQFGGQFKELSDNQIEELILYALSNGVTKFDTAPVYGSGSVEALLGDILPKGVCVVTKIPASKKPPINSGVNIEECYNPDQMQRSLEDSLKRLRVTSLDTILLHNWIPSWVMCAESIFEKLNSFKEQGLVERVGISLPNSFNSIVHADCLEMIDVIETPYNPKEEWIIEQIPHILSKGKSVLLRSIFDQGKLIQNDRSVEVVLTNALKLKTSVVIGMTTIGQIDQNIKIIKGKNDEL